MCPLIVVSRPANSNFLLKKHHFLINICHQFQKYYMVCVQKILKLRYMLVGTFSRTVLYTQYNTMRNNSIHPFCYGCIVNMSFKTI